MKTKLLSVLAFAAATTVSQFAAAADGTITFTGTISAQTCTAAGTAGGASTKDFAVTLPKVSNAALATVGSATGKTPFSISLTACTPETGNVHTFFEAGPTVDTTTGNLINSGTATNVQVGLLNGDGSVIKAGFADALQNSKPAALTTGAATMNYAAQYVATGAATAGTVSTTVQYTIVYP